MRKYLPLLFLITGIVVSFFIILYKPLFGWVSLIIVAIIRQMLNCYIYRDEKCLGLRRFTNIQAAKNYCKYVLPRISGYGAYYFVVKI